MTVASTQGNGSEMSVVVSGTRGSVSWTIMATGHDPVARMVNMVSNIQSGNDSGDATSRPPNIGTPEAAMHALLSGASTALLDCVSSQDLLSTALRKGVGPAVAQRLIDLPTDLVAPDLRPAAQQYLRDHAARVAGTVAMLIEVVRCLEGQNGIVCLPLKGPMLSFQLHGDIAARQGGDIDVLVPPRQARDACRLLAKAHWRAVDRLAVEPDGAPTRAHMRRKHELELRREGDGRVLELHWRLNDVPSLAPWDAEKLISRCETVKLGGREFRALAGAPLLAYLGMHALNSRWTSWKWIHDLTYVPKRYGPEILDEGFAIAEQAGFARMLDAGLGLSACLNGVDTAEFDLPRRVSVTTWRRDTQRLARALVRARPADRLDMRIEDRWGRMRLLDNWPTRLAMSRAMLRNVWAGRS